MPIVILECPECGHKYNVPTSSAKTEGFKQCPSCGITAEEFESLYVGDILSNADRDITPVDERILRDR